MHKRAKDRACKILCLFNTHFEGFIGLGIEEVEVQAYILTAFNWLIDKDRDVDS